MWRLCQDINAAACAGQGGDRLRDIMQMAENVRRKALKVFTDGMVVLHGLP